MDKIKIDAIEGPVDIKMNVPGSKNIIARAMILGALSDGKTIISNAVLTEDGKTMLNALRDLGFKVYYNASLKVVRVFGENGNIPSKDAAIYVGNAGLAVGFLSALLAFSDGTYVVNASPALSARPLKSVISALRKYGAKVTCLNKEGHLPFRIVGRKPKENELISMEIDGSENPQFLSGVLMALGCLPNRSTIKAVNLSHVSYTDATLEMIREVGGSFSSEENVFHCKGGKPYLSKEILTDTDVSLACFYYAAAFLLGGKCQIGGMNVSRNQPDLTFFERLEEYGASIDYENGYILESMDKNFPEGNTTIDMSDYSDQVSMMAIISALRKGKTKLTNIGHIRNGECDAISVIKDNLEKCGIDCKEGKDFLEIKGGKLKGAKIDPHGDWRIAMAFSVLGLLTGNMVIKNPDCVKHIYENFYEDILKIKGAIN